MQRENTPTAIARGRVNIFNDVRPLVTRDLILRCRCRVLSRVRVTISICVRNLPPQLYFLATTLSHIKHRPLNWSNSQLAYPHRASWQSGHDTSTPEATPNTIGIGDHDEAVEFSNNLAFGSYPGIAYFRKMNIALGSTNTRGQPTRRATVCVLPGAPRSSVDCFCRHH